MNVDVENHSGITVGRIVDLGPGRKPIKLGISDLIWGVSDEIKPITDAPPGKQRIRMRRKDCAKLYVRDSKGIRSFILRDKGDHWEVDYDLGQGRNYRP